jgi:hypothetical protein
VSIDAKHTLALATDGSVNSFGAGAGLGISRARGGSDEDVDEAARHPWRIPNLVCKVPR